MFYEVLIYKLFRVSTIVLMSCMILDCAAGTLIHYTKEQSYDQLV